MRNLDQSWTEWTPTWGMAFKFPEFELRYRGSVTNGGGRPGLFTGFGCFECRNVPDAAPGGVIVAPSGPLQLTDVQVVSHQVSIAIPLRGLGHASRSEKQ